VFQLSGHFCGPPLEKIFGVKQGTELQQIRHVEEDNTFGKTVNCNIFPHILLLKVSILH